jgi:hypothetical protein
MSKGLLKFNLPEEAHEHRCASNAMALVATISELQDWFRNKLKYEALSPETSKALEEGQALLFEELRSNGFGDWV